MKTTKHERMYARIQAHGEKLNAIFKTAHDPVTLCKKLRILEGKQQRANENLCNLPDYQSVFDKQCERTEKAVVKLLGDVVPVYINADPRGYALKIDDKIVRDRKLDVYKDWGGYGILAPDLSRD